MEERSRDDFFQKKPSDPGQFSGVFECYGVKVGTVTESCVCACGGGSPIHVDQASKRKDINFIRNYFLKDRKNKYETVGIQINSTNEKH